jgi:diaminohydroxyphosphoribosylaminopyrimidine deaminase/5-amino-6-(5-phosphoribosylamino)uracil reductase
MTSEDYIRKTFELASRAHGSTWPNPMVGAVIVKNDRIISEGLHQKKGGDHAEIDAIKKAKESVNGATIYVNLEPCCHTNKSTPPCSQRLIQEGIKKVVFCNIDPNENVNGKGIELLRSHGIEVIHGVLNEEGEKLNEVFFLSERLKRPFIHFKAATSLDGKIAMPSGESKWITGEEARLHVHHLRSLHQGIIIGGETLRQDNPKLTVRIPGFAGVQPWRIVITKSGDLPENHHLFQDEQKHRTIVYTQSHLGFNFPVEQVIKIKNIKEVMNDLYQKKIISILLESGAGLASSFMKENLIDRISLYQNLSFIGSGKDLFGELNFLKLENRPVITNIETQWIGNDHYITGLIKCSQDSSKK